MSTICVSASKEKTLRDVRCDNPSKHGGESKDKIETIFNASPEEFDYWERIQRLRRENIRREYLETGECLLCILDKSMEGKF